MPTPTATDRGSIVVGWLVKLVAFFAVVGVLVFDGVSLGIAQLAVTDSAAAAARAASLELSTGSTAQRAYEAALATSAQQDVTDQVPVEQFLVGADGSVTLTVRRTAPTLVLHHVPGSESWLVSSATASHVAG